MDKFSELVSKVSPCEDFKTVKNPEWVGIIIHHTGLPNRPLPNKEAWQKYHDAVVNWLTTKDNNYLSAHFVIARDGTITQLADPKTMITYHAGKSKYFHPILRREVEGWNNYAIGIELTGDGNYMTYSEEQYSSLINLCRELVDEFPTIDPRCLVGHENVSPDRKVDPGVNFHWRLLHGNVFKD